VVGFEQRSRQPRLYPCGISFGNVGLRRLFSDPRLLISMCFGGVHRYVHSASFVHAFSVSRRRFDILLWLARRLVTLRYHEQSLRADVGLSDYAAFRQTIGAQGSWRALA
jgi:hypothetical protein